MAVYYKYEASFIKAQKSFCHREFSETHLSRRLPVYLVLEKEVHPRSINSVLKNHMFMNVVFRNV